MDLKRGRLFLRVLPTRTENTSHAFQKVPEPCAINFTYLQETTLSEVTLINIHSTVKIQLLYSD